LSTFSSPPSARSSRAPRPCRGPRTASRTLPTPSTGAGETRRRRRKSPFSFAPKAPRRSTETPPARPRRHPLSRGGARGPRRTSRLRRCRLEQKRRKKEQKRQKKQKKQRKKKKEEGNGKEPPRGAADEGEGGASSPPPRRRRCLATPVLHHLFLPSPRPTKAAAAPSAPPRTAPWPPQARPGTRRAARARASRGRCAARPSPPSGAAARRRRRRGRRRRRRQPTAKTAMKRGSLTSGTPPPRATS